MRGPSHADDPTAGQPESFDARSASPGEITSHLRAARDGNAAAFDALYTRLYDELRRIARGVRAGRAGATLSTTSLVHEAYLKLDPSAKLSGEQRADFIA